MSKKLLTLLAALTLFVAAGCGDDGGDEGGGSDETTTTAAPESTTTTEAALALDDWVEQADEICEEADDAFAELEGIPADPTVEEAVAALEEALPIGQQQAEDIEALGLPDEDADLVEEAVELLADGVASVEDAIETAEDGDVEAALEMLQDVEGQERLSEIADELGLEVCGADSGGGGEEPPGDPFTYGDDPTLDALWDDCEAGDPDACDELWTSSPDGSEYSDFGYSCGGVVPEGETEICSDVLGGGGTTDLPVTGDPVIDTMLEECAGGNGIACDQAYALTEVGSDAEAFADSCGGTADAGSICAAELGGSKVEPEVSTGQSYGDDPTLDGYQDACADGDLAQCDLLFLVSPINSDYELFGGTCGETYAYEESPYSCVAGV